MRILCSLPKRETRFPSACSSTADGNGLLRQGRLYQLIREHDAVRDRDLEITFLRAGVEAYAFTFG